MALFPAPRVRNHRIPGEWRAKYPTKNLFVHLSLCNLGVLPMFKSDETVIAMLDKGFLFVDGSESAKDFSQLLACDRWIQVPHKEVCVFLCPSDAYRPAAHHCKPAEQGGGGQEEEEGRRRRGGGGEEEEGLISLQVQKRSTYRCGANFSWRWLPPAGSMNGESKKKKNKYAERCNKPSLVQYLELNESVAEAIARHTIALNLNTGNTERLERFAQLFLSRKSAGVSEIGKGMGTWAFLAGRTSFSPRARSPMNKQPA